ncbi:MAG: NUDIX domain-containing protein [Desulfobacteraceae bacterium]|nr:NUDIX domain-containing protein [Desulfobacteraceae bacterium]MBU4001196.1 NUDIX domain-containing protein [Pseudomonadota bacterium]MBU4053552.1 NUDIX domain-containing protein [Pseudomonadota bacterium]
MEPTNNHPFQFCPDCGQKNPDFHADRSISCKTCGFRYFLNTAATVAALIEDKNGALLLCSRAEEPGKGLLDLPGGFIEFNETAEEAVRREVKEELNLDIEDLVYMGSMPGNYVYNGWRYEILNMIFHCRVNNFRRIKANSDVADYRFVDKGKLDLSEIGLESIRSILKKYYKPS